MKTQAKKTKFGNACLLVTIAAGLAMVSGCVVEVAPGGEAPPPTVVVAAPEAVVVPDYYTWDGYEYVGVVGTQYYYLGSGQVWVVCDPVRVERFHSWEGGHPDWRDHATLNVNYRRDAHGEVHPMHQGVVVKERVDNHQMDTHQNAHPVGQRGVQNQKPIVHGNAQQGGAKKGKPAPKKGDDKKKDDQH
jgi:hypothetical protein